MTSAGSNLAPAHGAVRDHSRDPATRAHPGTPWPTGLDGADGIVCFGGEDWWYHNRGHFDMQMMREMSAVLPVLYVNSLGMRVPRPQEGRMFLARVRRKLQSMGRGLVRDPSGLNVYSPFAVPGRVGVSLTRGILTRGVRRAQRTLGITRPIVWVACPTAAAVVDALRPEFVVYQRTDRYECFADVDTEQIRQYDAWLKARADLTVFCSHHLYEREAAQCATPLALDHGIDATRFIDAARGGAPVPADVAAIPGPRVGFVGGIDAHTFDPTLFRAVAGALPDVQFVMVGASSLPAGWCPLENVHWLGQRAYDDVPAYMAACDVLIMPWQRSEWIESCNPIKLKEYLATGRPIVSVPFPELRRVGDLVRVADDSEAFAGEIREALANPGDAHRRQSVVRNQPWSLRARTVLEALQTSHAVPDERPVAPSILSAAAARTPDVAGTGRATVESRERAPHVSAVIILATALRPSALQRACGRPVLDLWLSAEQTVLDAWLARCADIDRFGDAESPEGERSAPPVRIVLDDGATIDSTRLRAHRHVTLETTPRAFRGPAGTIADLCRTLAPDQHVLVVEAARAATVPLTSLVRHHHAENAEVTIATNPDGAPAGAYVIRGAALANVPSRGFVDLKEQWLPRVQQAGARVLVHPLPAPGLHPLRTREDLLLATIAHGAPAPRLTESDLHCDVLHEGRSSGSTVVCPGALIGPGATVVDSILMPGALVHADALVARSVICPGAQVARGARIVDTIVTASESRTEGHPACA